MRSPAQLRAIFAALRGKSPLGRAKSLYKQGMLRKDYMSKGFHLRKGQGEGGWGRSFPKALGLKMFKNPRYSMSASRLTAKTKDAAKFYQSARTARKALGVKHVSSARAKRY